MYYYLVEYWDSDSQKVVTESGMCGGTTYSAAAEKVVKLYGAKSLVSMKLTELDGILYEEEILDMFNHEV